MTILRSACAYLAICMALTSSPTFAGMPEVAIDEINAFRKQKGRTALRTNNALMYAAQKHADELVKRGYGTKLKTGGHKGRNGSSPKQRLKRAGYKSCTTVENLAWGQKTVPVVLAEWMKSSGHRRNLLHNRIHEIGIGFAPPKTWVMVGARRC